MWRLRISRCGRHDSVCQLVIKASNFSQVLLGAMRIEIGRADTIDAQQTRHWALAMTSVGVLLIGFYHLGRYCFRRRETGALYLGLNCLCWVGTILCMGASEWVIRVFVPDAPGEVLYRIWPVCLFLASAFAYPFYRALYPNEFPRWIARVADRIAGLRGDRAGRATARARRLAGVLRDYRRPAGVFDVGAGGDGAAQRLWRGKVVIAGRWTIPVWHDLRAAFTLFWREAGF